MSPVEAKVFIKADICGTRRVTSRQPRVFRRSQNPRRWRCHRLEPRFPLEVHICGARAVSPRSRRLFPYRSQKAPRSCHHRPRPRVLSKTRSAALSLSAPEDDILFRSPGQPSSRCHRPKPRALLKMRLFLLQTGGSTCG